MLCFVSNAKPHSHGCQEHFFHSGRKKISPQTFNLHVYDPHFSYSQHYLWLPTTWDMKLRILIREPIKIVAGSISSYVKPLTTGKTMTVINYLLSPCHQVLPTMIIPKVPQSCLTIIARGKAVHVKWWFKNKDLDSGLPYQLVSEQRYAALIMLETAAGFCKTFENYPSCGARECHIWA